CGPLPRHPELPKRVSRRGIHILFTGSSNSDTPAKLSAADLSTGSYFVVCTGLSQLMSIRQDSRQGLSSQKQRSSAPAASFRNGPGSRDLRRQAQPPPPAAQG